MVAAERAKVTETETWKRQQETLLEREQDGLRSAKLKLNASRTGKEYNAASKEIDNKRRSMLEREAEVQKVMDALGETTAQVVAHEADVEGIRQTLAAEEAVVAERIEALKVEAVAAGAGRDEIRAQIDPALLKTYDKMSATRGFGVAPVEKGVCRGCHTSLLPQLNNTLARGDSIETCPRCSRIIYRPEVIDPPAAEEG